MGFKVAWPSTGVLKRGFPLIELMDLGRGQAKLNPNVELREINELMAQRVLGFQQAVYTSTDALVLGGLLIY